MRMQERGFRQFLLHCLLALCCCVGGLLSADTITLNNGATITGKIVFQDGAEVHIERAGILTVITTDRIQTIDRSDDSAIGPGEAFATEARSLLDRGNAASAWNALLQMRTAEPESVGRNSPLVRRTWNQVIENTSLLKRDNLAGAVELVHLLNDDDSLAMLNEALPSDSAGELERLRLVTSEVYWLEGREYRRQGNTEKARESLAKSIESLRPQDTAYASVIFDYARLHRDMGATAAQFGRAQESEAAYRKALELYQTAQQSAQRDATMVRAIMGEMAQVRDSLNAVVAASRPTPTPLPTAPPLIIYTPTPTPTPEPGFIGRVFGSSAEDKLAGFVDSVLPEGWNSRKSMSVAAYVLLFVVCYWVIPYMIFWLLMRRVDFVANEWKPRVKLLGPFALIGYIVSFIRLPGQAKEVAASTKPCPHCGFNLDHILQYETLDFHHCPNCGGEIEPLFSIEAYIDQVGASLATDAEKLQMGMVSMASFVEKDLMQRLVQALTTKAVRQRASDIHIEPQNDHLGIRYRIDGIIIDVARLAPSLGPAVVSAVKVKANMDIAEKRRPQDGAMQIIVDGAPIDVRVASSPSQTGETVSLRLLDFRSIQVDPKRLGMSKSTRELFDKAIQEPHGLIVVCGPTGSGKTTTLYVGLQMIATGSKNIISIEDPIEFRLPRINQIQVNPAAGLTFANGLRSILRQDPDVLMIGEIRDKETAEIAVNAAQTGHLVFTSLHTIDAASAVTRLFDLGIAPRQFADALSLIIAQRLIRLVCPHCAKPHKPKDAVIKEIGIISSELQKYEFVNGTGCDKCNNTGYLGRTGLFELLAPNTAIRSALEKSTITTAELRELAISAGMRTLREEALILLRSKLTTPEEVLRMTK